MKRKSIGKVHEMPIQPAYIIGTYNEDGTQDFAPITWVSKTCEKDYDYLIVISMYGTKQTKQNVLRSGQFSINLVSTDMLVLMDYFGQTSGKKGVKDGIDLTQFNPVIYSGNYHSIGNYLGKIGDYYKK